MNKLNLLVVGAGIAGATAARALTDAGHQVTVIDKLPHIAGNCYDYNHRLTNTDKTILVQKYGPHIFHTNSQRVFEFLSRFTEWKHYTHHVCANLGANCSIGMTINGKALVEDLLENFLDLNLTKNKAKNILGNIALELGSTNVSIGQLLGASSVDAKLIGSVLWKKVYEPYTLYQWGTTDVDPSVFDRVRIQLDGFDENPSYFKDKWQVMPTNGFTSMVDEMLKGIEVNLNTNFTVASLNDYDHVFCTAPIDEALHSFGFEEAPLLPYRTMYAHIEESLRGHLASFFHANATYNNASSYYSGPRSVLVNGEMRKLKAPIRYTSFTKLGNESVRPDAPDVYCLEFPMPWEEGLPRHYPMPNPEARALYDRYDVIAKQTLPKVTFFGRLGSYQYLNIDQAVAQAMKVVETFLLKA